jgi:hypothetical protein
VFVIFTGRFTRYVSLALQQGFLHGKKTGLDNFMAICEFGNESGAIKRGFTVYR